MLLDYHMHLAEDDAPLDEPALTMDAIGRYVDAARSRGVAEICMTEHVYRFAATREWFEQPWWREGARNELAPYVEALQRARDDAGWAVLVGIELDYLPDRHAELRAWAEGQPWDLVLGSVHWLGSLGVDHPDYPVWEALEVEDVWRRYFDALAEAAATGIYDVMAHPDLAKVFGHRPSERVRELLYEEAAEAFATAGVAIEVSTAGLRKGARELYPAPAFLAACRRAGIPATLASDAHRPEDVGRDFDLAVAALREAGYATIARFRGRERQEVPLG
jgi:histidinol-phosphatase (PHP family)